MLPYSKSTNCAVFKNEGIIDPVNLNTEEYRLDIINIKVNRHTHTQTQSHTDTTEYHNPRACAIITKSQFSVVYHALLGKSQYYGGKL